MKKILVLVLLSLFLTGLSLLSGMVNWIFQFCFVSLIYFYEGVYSFKLSIKFNVNKLVYITIMLLPIFIVLSVLYLFVGKPPMYVYPIDLAPFFFIIIGFFIQKYVNNRFTIKLLIISVTIFILIISYVGMPNYFAYLSSDNVNTIQYPNITYKTTDSLDYKIQSSENIVVIDFWTTTCGVCYRKFPEYNNLVNYYKNKKSDIGFYAICLKTSRDNFQKMKDVIDELDYNFDFLIADSLATKTLYDSLNIDGVPHFLVIDKEKIIYSGSLNTNKGIFIENMYNVIDNLERE